MSRKVRYKTNTVGRMPGKAPNLNIIQIDNRRKLLLLPETHTKRKATQHGCLPSLLGAEDKEIKIVSVRKNIFCTGRLEQLRQNKKVP
jgi:hypothetical protein